MLSPVEHECELPVEPSDPARPVKLHACHAGLIVDHGDDYLFAVSPDQHGSGQQYLLSNKIDDHLCLSSRKSLERQTSNVLRDDCGYSFGSFRKLEHASCEPRGRVACAPKFMRKGAEHLPPGIILCRPTPSSDNSIHSGYHKLFS